MLREKHRKSRPCPLLRNDAQLAAMAVYHMLDDGKAKTGATLLQRGNAWNAVEPLGEPRQMLTWNARTVVLDGDLNHGRGAILHTLQRDVNRAAGPAVLDRVVQQVDKNLRKLVAVAKNGCAAHARGPPTLIFASAAMGSSASQACTTSSPIITVSCGFKCARISTRLNDMRLSISRAMRWRLLGHDRQEAVAGHLVVTRSALKRLDKSQKRGKRRFDLVARIGDKVGTELIQAPLLGQVAQEKKNGALVRRPG